MDTAQPTMPSAPRRKHSSYLLGLFLLIALFAIGFGIYAWQMNMTMQTNAPQAVPSPTNVQMNDEAMKAETTYTNNHYNFTLKIPAVGVYPGGQVGICGKGIKEDSTIFPESNDPSIVVDNFFVIRVIAWDKSIADYIQSQKAAGLYNTQPIQNSNADEALSLTGLKQAPTGNGEVPLGYVNEMYKKGNKLFLVTDVQNAGNPEGCLLPSGVNPTRYPQVNHNWSVTNSLTFTN